jgi:phosphoglycolate phosphatase
MNIELVVFDWSGVISDDRRPVYEANMDVLSQYGKPVMSFEEWLPNTTMTPIEFFNNNGIFDDPQVLFNLYKKYFDEVGKKGMRPTVYPDAYQTLKYLKDINKTLVVLSSHPEENLKNEAILYRLAAFFSNIKGSCRDKVQGLKDICSEMTIGRKNTLYIGDTIYDVRSAKQAGVISAAVCQGYHVEKRLAAENPDILLENLSELRRYLS